MIDFFLMYVIPHLCPIMVIIFICVILTELEKTNKNIRR
jgi:hypothetical protein